MLRLVIDNHEIIENSLPNNLEFNNKELIIPDKTIIKEPLIIKLNNDNNEEIKRKTDLNKCQYCGAALIERNGPYGIFIGCSNYPKCKYTRKK